MNKLTAAKFHFIGIGGIGMCGLAELLYNMGAKVSGSDISENKQVVHLKKIGIQVYIGHEAEQCGNADVVVYSSAIKHDNVEYQEATKKKIPLIPRAEALAEIMHLKRGIAIAGTHGKTTTTSLTASIFLEAKKEPTIVVGGRLDIIKSTALLGAGEWLIAEADESDGSFMLLSPEVVVITNVDNDHLDHYGSFEKLQQAFVEFAESVPFYGIAIVCGDDEDTYNLFKDCPKKVVFYGLHKRNDYILSGKGGDYSLSYKGKDYCNFSLPIPGEHNALNAVASLLCGTFTGIDKNIAVKGLEKFAGVDRRFQFKGLHNGARVYDDYGHHPTEVLAVLKAFKEKYHNKTIKVIFQPHRYSRMEVCWSDFLTSFSDADEVMVLDIYKAGEKPVDGIDARNFVAQADHNNIVYVPDSKQLVSELKSSCSEQDIVLTLGAGDVYKIAEELVD